MAALLVGKVAPLAGLKVPIPKGSLAAAPAGPGLAKGLLGTSLAGEEKDKM